MVEIDECKISLVMSAKTGGFWERMSRDERDALETLKEHIRSRFWILVRSTWRAACRSPG